MIQLDKGSNLDSYEGFLPPDEYKGLGFAENKFLLFNTTAQEMDF